MKKASSRTGVKLRVMGMSFMAGPLPGPLPLNPGRVAAGTLCQVFYRVNRSQDWQRGRRHVAEYQKPDRTVEMASLPDPDGGDR